MTGDKIMAWGGPPRNITERRRKLAFEEAMQLLGRALVDPPPEPQMYLRNLQDDRERQLFCISMAEHYRTLWYDGMRAQIDAILYPTNKAGKIRYQLFGPRDRRSIGVMLWVKSARAKDLASGEEIWDRRAKLYASARRES